MHRSNTDRSQVSLLSFCFMPSVSSPNISEAPLPPTIRALGWSSFLTDMASEAIYPLLPAFFMRELGLTSVGVGLLDGLASATAAIVRLPAGMLSDRMGRRPLVIVGYTLATLSRPFMGMVTGPFGASIVRVADRFGKGVRSAPRDALVADLVPSDMRGRAFGHIRAMDHAGAAAGPLVAMLFLWWFPGRERALFMLTILPGLAALAVVVRFVHDPYPVRRALRADIPAQPLWPSLTGPQKTLLGCVALYSLGASSEQFLLMRATDLLHSDGMTTAVVPLIWLAVSLTKSLSARYTGRLSDRMHPRIVLAFGWLIFAAAYAGLSLSTDLWTSLGLIMLVGISYGISEPAERSLVSLLSQPDQQGSAFGWYMLVQGLLALPASVLTGWLWHQGNDGVSIALAVSAGLPFAAAVVLWSTRSTLGMQK